MSWHFSANGVTPEELERNLEKSTPVYSAHGVKEQVEAAIPQTIDLIKTENFGKGPFRVVLSGHAKQGDSDIHGNTLSISIHSYS